VHNYIAGDFVRVLVNDPYSAKLNKGDIVEVLGNTTDAYSVYVKPKPEDIGRVTKWYVGLDHIEKADAPTPTFERGDIVNYNGGGNRYKVLSTFEGYLWTQYLGTTEAFYGGSILEVANVTPYIAPKPVWEQDKKYKYTNGSDTVYTVTGIDSEGNALLTWNLGKNVTGEKASSREFYKEVDQA
jgi:hypothetical protein